MTKSYEEKLEINKNYMDWWQEKVGDPRVAHIDERGGITIQGANNFTKKAFDYEGNYSIIPIFI
jgi:hypothetical protein